MKKNIKMVIELVLLITLVFGGFVLYEKISGFVDQANEVYRENMILKSDLARMVELIEKNDGNIVKIRIGEEADKQYFEVRDMNPFSRYRYEMLYLNSKVK